jgi:hypothetical protein
MSAQARRERAYNHYVAKQMKKRQKEMARAQKAANRDMKRKIKDIGPSGPTVTTSVQDYSPESESMPSSQAPEPMSAPVPSSADLVVAPITVSRTGSTSNETTEPSQP